MEVNIKEFFLSLLTEKEKNILTRLEAMDRITSAAQAAAKEAVEKAEIANQRHFTAINGLQASLDKQQQTLVSKHELSLLLEPIIKELNILRESVTTGEGESKGIKWLWGAIVAAVGAVIGAISAMSVTFK